MTNRTTHRTCPRGANHRHHGPLPPERVAHIRREGRRLSREEKRNAIWLASHFGVTVEQVRQIVGVYP